jgi:nucleobase:cation symporter-1, NCS1 family
MILSWTKGISKVHNPFDSTVTMTGGRLIGFSIAWVILMFCTLIPVHKLRKVVYYKSAVMTICLFAFFGWFVSPRFPSLLSRLIPLGRSLGRAGGVGPVVKQGAQIPEGKSHGWVDHSVHVNLTTCS